MFFKQINRLQQIDQLIRQKRTGNAEELANKLKISRRQVYNWLDELKGIGLEIDYCRDVRSFIYAKPYRINITIDIRDLTSEEQVNFDAGVNFLKKFVL